MTGMEWVLLFLVGAVLAVIGIRALRAHDRKVNARREAEMLRVAHVVGVFRSKDSQ